MDCITCTINIFANQANYLFWIVIEMEYGLGTINVEIPWMEQQCRFCGIKLLCLYIIHKCIYACDQKILHGMRNATTPSQISKLFTANGMAKEQFQSTAICAILMVIQISLVFMRLLPDGMLILFLLCHLYYANWIGPQTKI